MKKLQAIAAAVILGVSGASAMAANATAQISLAGVSGTPSSPIYNYAISMTNTSAFTIGTFWFGWIPGQNYLPSLPSSTGNPAGWGNSITSGSTFAIEWQAGSAASYVQPGGSLSGFTFSSADSLDVLAGNAAAHPTTPILTTTTYSQGAFSADSATLVVSEVPEPASLSLLLLGAGGLAARRRPKA